MDIGAGLTVVRSVSVSANSLRTCAFMIGVEAVFFRCGFTIGDCLTPDFLVLPTFFCRTFFKSTALGGGVLDSRSISTGEFVAVEL